MHSPTSFSEYASDPLFEAENTETVELPLGDPRASDHSHLHTDVHGGQTTAFHDAAPPAAYWVESCRADVSGGYTRTAGALVNSRYVWEHDDGCVLYCTPLGAWAIASSHADAVNGSHVGVVSARDDAPLPHLVEVWLIDGEEDTTTQALPHTNATTNVEDLMVHTAHVYYRYRGYRHFAYYFVFLFFLVFDFAYSDRAEAIAWDTKSAEQILRVKKLPLVVEEVQMWQWMERAVADLWELSPEVVDPALRKKQLRFGRGVLIQQYRAEAAPCSIDDNYVVSLSAQNSSSYTCATRFSPTVFSREPFGTNLTFNYSNQGSDPRFLNGFNRHNLQIISDTHNYPDTTLDSYMVPLSTAESVEETVARLREMQNASFIDAYSRFVTWDVVFVSPDPDTPVVMVFQVYFEYLSAGYVVAGFAAASATSADPMGGQFRAFFVYLWSGTCIVLSVSLLQSLVVKVRLRRAGKNRNAQSFFGFWEFYEGVHVYVFLTLLFGSWTELLLTPCGDDMFECFQWFQPIATDAYRREVGAWLLMVSLIRILKYFRYNRSLNALSETVRVAIKDLAGVVITFVLIHFTFAMGGTMLYGSELLYYRTPAQSASHLLRILVSASISDWDAVYRVHRTSSALFFGLYFVMVWLLMLNMVLAIVAAAFAVVHSRMTETIRVDSIYFLFSNFRASYSAYTEQRRKYIQGGMKLRGRLSIVHGFAEVFFGWSSLEIADPPTQQLVSLLSLLRCHADAEVAKKVAAVPGTRKAEFPDSVVRISSLQFRRLCYIARPPLTDADEIYALFDGSRSTGDTAAAEGGGLAPILDKLSALDEVLRRHDALLTKISSQMDTLTAHGSERLDTSKNGGAVIVKEPKEVNEMKDAGSPLGSAKFFGSLVGVAKNPLRSAVQGFGSLAGSKKEDSGKMSLL